MERKINPCLCGGDVEITKCRQSSGMDGCYEDWEFNCKKCGGSWTWAADNFYGRKFYTKDDVIDIWNKTHADKEVRDDMEVVNNVLNEFIRQQREHTERTLAEIITKYDFIVGSKECKFKLMEILPEGANIVCSPYIESPTTIYAIKKFDARDLIMGAQAESEG